MKLDAHTADEYFSKVPEERQAIMNALRAMILADAPDVSEEFLHQLPFYNLNGYLFALASQKHYMSFYSTYHDLVDKYANLMKGATSGKSCIRFKKLPEENMEILKKLVAEAYERRCKENAEG